MTITIPGTAKDVITVGAIDIGASSRMMKPYGYSSSGPCQNGQEKPEVVAPGVGVRGAAERRVDGALLWHELARGSLLCLGLTYAAAAGAGASGGLAAADRIVLICLM